MMMMGMEVVVMVATVCGGGGVDNDCQGCRRIWMTDVTDLEGEADGDELTRTG